MGGKSMGGRVAVGLRMKSATGLVCLVILPSAGEAREAAYRTSDRLEDASNLCQGERDTLGTRDEIATFSLRRR